MEESQKHKKLISEIFDRTSENYGTIGPDTFNYFGEKIARFANIQESALIIDLGCGRGASLFHAYKMLGDSGKIIGIDISKEMIGKTKQEIRNRGINNIEFHEMDIEDLKFSSDQFDVALCGFSLSFLPDLKKGLSEIRRVLKPGGVFVSSTFGERDNRWKPVRELISQIQNKLEPVKLAKTQILNFKEEITTLFEAERFKEIKIFSEEKEFYYKDEDEWWQSLWTHGYRGFLERLNETSLEEFKKESFEIVSRLKNKNGIPEKINVFITKASK